ncbi:MAG: hypothetical protein U1E59_06245 [Amaricoccus sp.]
MICSTNGIAVATIAASIRPVFQPLKRDRGDVGDQHPVQEEEQRPARGEDAHQRPEGIGVRADRGDVGVLLGIDREGLEVRMLV